MPIPARYTYTPGMTEAEFLAANGYDKNSDPLEVAFAMRSAYNAFRRQGGEVDTSGPEGRGGVRRTTPTGRNRGPRTGDARSGGSRQNAYDATEEAGTPGTPTTEDLIARLSDPTYGLAFYERLAAAAAPSYADYAARLAQMGGSALQAREQEEAVRRQSQGAAFNAWERFKLGADQAALNASIGVLNADVERDRLAQQDQQYQQGRRDSLINQVLGIGGNLIGMYVGSKWFPKWIPPTGPTYSYPNPYGTSGANWGGVQQPGQQTLSNPSGPNPYGWLGF